MSRAKAARAIKTDRDGRPCGAAAHPPHFLRRCAPEKTPGLSRSPYPGASAPGKPGAGNRHAQARRLSPGVSLQKDDTANKPHIPSYVLSLTRWLSMVDVKELNFTRTKPEIKDIAGVWTPDEDTLRDITQRGQYPDVKHELILRQDGTFSMVNMPDWWRDGFGKSNKGFESGDGRWSLTKGSNIWAIWQIQLEFPSGLSFVNLYRQKSPFLIFIRVGDPNNGKAMFIERRSTS